MNQEDLELQFLTQDQLDQLELTEEDNNSQECMIYEEELKEPPTLLKPSPEIQVRAILPYH